MSAFDPKRTLPKGERLSRIGFLRGIVMHFDIDEMAAMDRYELLLGTVVPRPICLGYHDLK